MSAQLKGVTNWQVFNYFLILIHLYPLQEEKGGGCVKSVEKANLDFLSSSTTIHCADIGNQRVVALLAIKMPGTLLAKSAEPQKFVEGPVILVQCVGRAKSGAFGFLHREWNRGLAVSGPGQDSGSCRNLHARSRPLGGLVLSQVQYAVAPFQSTLPLAYQTWRDR
jgi:hypothetical protein